MRSLAGKDVREQPGIIELIEEPFDWSDVESVLVISPKDLVPGGGRAIEQTFGRDDHPFGAVVERNERQQMFARVCVPKKSAALFAGRCQQTSVRAEIHRLDVRGMPRQRTQLTF